MDAELCLDVYAHSHEHGDKDDCQALRDVQHSPKDVLGVLYIGLNTLRGRSSAWEAHLSKRLSESRGVGAQKQKRGKRRDGRKNDDIDRLQGAIALNKAKGRVKFTAEILEHLSNKYLPTTRTTLSTGHFALVRLASGRKGGIITQSGRQKAFQT